jgi:excisionase family DNA binding protein
MPTKTPAPLPDLSRREAAAILGCGLGKIDKLCADGTLRSYKLAATRRGARRITRESLEALRRGETPQEAA